MTVQQLLRSLPVFDRPLPVFEVEAAPENPITLFLDWMVEAIDAGVSEPHAMTVSTVDIEGRPDARVLILNDVDAAGWHFATSATSAKGRQLASTPNVALSFYWREQGRQVRVRGRAVAADRQRCAEDFLARPEGSRVAGLVGRQSERLADPAMLDHETEVARRRLMQDEGAVAEEHTVYVVRPQFVEFWQGDAQRRHTRLRYWETNDGWARERLWP